jgi:lysophospholipase
MAIKSPERDAIVQNGWAVATQLNSTRDPDWDVCVGCAMLSRSFERTKTAVPDKCNQCFTRYCWNGTLNETKPAPYVPSMYGKPILVKSSDAPGQGLRTMMTTMGLMVMAVTAFNL